jgi:hypothetical protein
VHKEMRSAGFLVWFQYQGRWFLPVCLRIGGFKFPDLGLKIGSYGFVI